MFVCIVGYMLYMLVIDLDFKLREVRGSGFVCFVVFIFFVILFYEKLFWVNWVISVFKFFFDVLNFLCNDFF